MGEQAYVAFLEAGVRRMHLYPDERTGQAYFNALADIAPWIAEAVRTTPLDPFYRDERLPDFFDFVAKQMITNG